MRIINYNEGLFLLRWSESNAAGRGQKKHKNTQKDTASSWEAQICAWRSHSSNVVSLPSEHISNPQHCHLLKWQPTLPALLVFISLIQWRNGEKRGGGKTRKLENSLFLPSVPRELEFSLFRLYSLNFSLPGICLLYYQTSLCGGENVSIEPQRLRGPTGCDTTTNWFPDSICLWAEGARNPGKWEMKIVSLREKMLWFEKDSNQNDPCMCIYQLFSPKLVHLSTNRFDIVHICCHSYFVGGS